MFLLRTGFSTALHSPHQLPELKCKMLTLIFLQFSPLLFKADSDGSATSVKAARIEGVDLSAASAVAVATTSPGAPLVSGDAVRPSRGTAHTDTRIVILRRCVWLFISLP